VVALGQKLDKRQKKDQLEFVRADVFEISAVSQWEGRGC